MIVGLTHLNLEKVLTKTFKTLAAKKKLGRGRIFGIILTVLVATMSISASNNCCVKTESKTIRVPYDYPTIQQAIDAADSGDTIFVFSGIYYESLKIWKPLTITGENRFSTKIHGNNLTDTVTITASHVNLARFTVSNGKNGISLHNVYSCNISDNIITLNSGHGVYLTFSYNNILNNNEVKNNGEGGIILHFSPNNKLRNNNMANNRWNFGVLAATLPSGSRPQDFFEDIDASNKVDGKPIYYWINQSNREVPSNAGYIALINSTNISIKNSYISKNLHGILLSFSSRITIENVSFTKNSEGIYFWYSRKNKVTHSKFYENHFGIHMLFSDKNLLIFNDISNNYKGVFMEDYCRSNIFQGNIISRNYYGIHLWPSYYNVIFANNVSNNHYGISQESAKNNMIYHNNILGNDMQVYSGPNTYSIWHNGYPSGGNYWSDYVDLDLYSGPHQNETGSDGIWDHPYIIDRYNQDLYPLVKAYKPPLPIHDIAIIKVALSEQSPIVNKTIKVYVTVENQGTISEIFDVSVKLTSLFVFNSKVITQTVTLKNGATETLEFEFVPTAALTCIEIFTSTISGENDLADNIYIFVLSCRGASAGGNVPLRK